MKLLNIIFRQSTIIQNSRQVISVSYKTIKPTAEKLKKLAEKATGGPWSAHVKTTDCIIYPSEEENDTEQTVIFENQFPDSACKHNTRFILACRNFIEGFTSDVIRMMDSQRWRDAGDDSAEMPIFDEPVEVLFEGYPYTARLTEIRDGALYSRIWVSVFTGEEIMPTHWRPLQQAGRMISGFGRKAPPKQKFGIDYYIER